MLRTTSATGCTMRGASAYLSASAAQSVPTMGCGNPPVRISRTYARRLLFEKKAQVRPLLGIFGRFATTVGRRRHLQTRAVSVSSPTSPARPHHRHPE
jgi:hypothetical protein